MAKNWVGNWGYLKVDGRVESSVEKMDLWWVVQMVPQLDYWWVSR